MDSENARATNMPTIHSPSSSPFPIHRRGEALTSNSEALQDTSLYTLYVPPHHPKLELVSWVYVVD